MPLPCAEMKTRREKAGGRFACLLLTSTPRADVFVSPLEQPRDGTVRKLPRDAALWKRRCGGHSYARREKQVPSKKPQTRRDEVRHPHPTGLTHVIDRGTHAPATAASITLQIRHKGSVPISQNILFCHSCPPNSPPRIPEEHWKREERG